MDSADRELEEIQRQERLLAQERRELKEMEQVEDGLDITNRIIEVLESRSDAFFKKFGKDANQLLGDINECASSQIITTKKILAYVGLILLLCAVPAGWTYYQMDKLSKRETELNQFEEKINNAVPALKNEYMQVRSELDQVSQTLSKKKEELEQLETPNIIGKPVQYKSGEQVFILNDNIEFERVVHLQSGKTGILYSTYK